MLCRGTNSVVQGLGSKGEGVSGPVSVDTRVSRGGGESED